MQVEELVFDEGVSLARTCEDLAAIIRFHATIQNRSIRVICNNKWCLHFRCGGCDDYNIILRSTGNEFKHFYTAKFKDHAEACVRPEKREFNLAIKDISCLIKTHYIGPLNVKPLTEFMKELGVVPEWMPKKDLVRRISGAIKLLNQSTEGLDFLIEYVNSITSSQKRIE